MVKQFLVKVLCKPKVTLIAVRCLFFAGVAGGGGKWVIPALTSCDGVTLACVNLRSTN